MTFSDQADLFGRRAYPHKPGHRGVETSVEAANAVEPKLGRLQHLAERAIANAGGQGLTADELAEALNLDRWTIQPRTSELKRLGRIVDSGLRRRNATGKRAIVWIRAPSARDAS